MLILCTVIESLKQKRQKMHTEELLLAVQCGDRTGTWIPLMLHRDMSTVVHPRYQKVSKVFADFQSTRVTSKNYRRECELVPSSSGPTLESALYLTPRRRKPLRVAGFLPHFTTVSLSSFSLSHLCPEGLR